MWLEGTGKIVYDPYRGGMKNRANWWCVVELDREITRYYRWWVERRYHVTGLCQPSWDAHISVIRGEKPDPDVMHLWKKYDKQVVKFKYKHEPRMVTDTFYNEVGDFWFVDIDCPQLLDIRREFNKPADWNLHLTIGRTWY